MANSEISSVIRVLRWIAVLPSGVFFSILAMFPIHWSVMLIHYFGRSTDGARITIEPAFPLAAVDADVLEALGRAFVTPLVMIVIGAKVAPSFKFPTGIGLAVLWGIVFGTVVEKAVSQGWYSGWGWFSFAFAFLFGICGVALGLYLVHKMEQPRPNPLDAPFENQIVILSASRRFEFKLSFLASLCG